MEMLKENEYDFNDEVTIFLYSDEGEEAEFEVTISAYLSEEEFDSVVRDYD